MSTKAQLQPDRSTYGQVEAVTAPVPHLLRVSWRIPHADLLSASVLKLVRSFLGQTYPQTLRAVQWSRHRWRFHWNLCCQSRDGHVQACETMVHCYQLQG
jgi:hypothetical protein